MELKDNYIITKSNSLISNVRHKTTLLEFKFLAVMTSLVQPEDLYDRGFEVIEDKGKREDITQAMKESVEAKYSSFDDYLRSKLQMRI